MSTKIRAGVVGVGSMGWNHARIYGELDNAELAAIWPNIAEMKPAPADAEEWNTVPNKLQYLER